MDLDLERFWAVVRPHRRKPAPKPTPKNRQSTVWIEVVESGPTVCTGRIRVPLKIDRNNNLTCEVEFPEFDHEVTIVGFNLYLRANAREFRYLECDPRNIRLGDTAKLNLNIVDDFALKHQIVGFERLR
jgi:hypothetical protein